MTCSSPPPPTSGYRYVDDLSQLAGCHPQVPTRLPSHMEEVHCPLPWWEWDRSLATDLDQHFQAYIIDGLRYGFQVGFDYQHAYQKSLQNMSSALEQPQVI